MAVAVRWIRGPIVAAIEIVPDDVRDAASLAGELEDALRRDHGFDAWVTSEDDCLVVPPPHEVRLGGRTLRDDEDAGYASALLAAAATLPTREIRSRVETMVPLDWDAFDAGAWARLDTLHASLPGWLGPGDLPRWFGRDERKGPFLWASVEPSGLHVMGCVALARFEDWQTRLLAGLAGMPVRDG